MNNFELRLRSLILTGIAAFTAGCTPQQTDSKPDYVFLDGKVLTVDEEFSIVEAAGAA